MDLNEARQIVKKRLKIARYEHTLRVEETAVELAKRYKESTEKAALAGILHDIAKCDPTHQLKDSIYFYQLPKTLFNYNKELWHGPVGARVVEKDYGVTDQDVLNAIYYHTTAREKMSKLEKIVFVADYIEPGRKFPGVDEVREIVNKDLDLAAQKVLKNTIIHLVNKDIKVYPDTFLAYNQFTNSMRGVG